MKNLKFAGTVCACIGLALCAGSSIVSGILAVSFLGVGAVCLNAGARSAHASVKRDALQQAA